MEESIFDSFYENDVTSLPKSYKRTVIKRISRPISLITVDAEILTKILANTLKWSFCDLNIKCFHKARVLRSGASEMWVKHKVCNFVWGLTYWWNYNLMVLLGGDRNRRWDLVEKNGSWGSNLGDCIWSQAPFSLTLFCSLPVCFLTTMRGATSSSMTFLHCQRPAAMELADGLAISEMD